MEIIDKTSDLRTFLIVTNTGNFTVKGTSFGFIGSGPILVIYVEAEPVACFPNYYYIIDHEFKIE